MPLQGVSRSPAAWQATRGASFGYIRSCASKTSGITCNSLPCWLQGIHKLVLREFLNPRHWRPPENRDFLFTFDQICQLCDQAEELFKREPSVLKLRGERVWLVGLLRDSAATGGTLSFLEL
jgi:hypothetical protein